MMAEQARGGTSFRLGLLILVCAPLTAQALAAAVRLLHKGSIPILRESFFRSREIYPVEFYLEITGDLRRGILAAQVLLGVLLVLRRALDWEDVAQRVSAWLEVDTNIRRAAGALTISGLVAAFALGSPVFETNDDAATAAFLAGSWTGAPEPETGFIGVGLAQILVVLSSAAPGIPWWGVTLLLLQAIAVHLLFLGLLRSATPSTASYQWWLGLSTVASFAVYSLRFLQFTHVALTMAAAVTVLGWQSQAHGKPDRNRSTILALALFMAVASQIRFEAAILGASLTLVLLALWTLLSRSRLSMTHLRMGVVLLGVGLAVHGIAGPAVGESLEQEWSAPLHPSDACFGEEQSLSWQRVAEKNSGPLTPNDRELIARWVRPTPSIFGAGASRQWTGHVTSTNADECTYSVDIKRLPNTVLALAVVLMSVGLSIPNPSARRRLFAATIASFPPLMLFSLGAISRVPLRVALPVMVVAAAAIAAATDRTEAPKGSGDRSREAILLLAVLAPAAIIAGLLHGRLSQEVWEAESRRMFSELLVRATIESDPAIVLAWLDPLFESHPALERPMDVSAGRPLGVAGWTSALSSHDQVLRRWGIEDWIGAVAWDLEVLLVLRDRDLEVLATFLRERRGVSCPMPDVVLRDDHWIVIRAFYDACASQNAIARVVHGD